ncbi:MAG: GlcNAc-PI de-N-acetylase [Rhodospirillaceae bacterium]|nr:GlcNAc-PI de-N-acetylase [Rhodospirillaceae bacterium]|tara:strand:- start:141 stop:821 length:681 start_codon:yes stop_codon:yes gene_type:complete
MKKKCILCVVAHPDDEALGVGGTLIKHVERGDKVNIIILSEGEGAKLLKKERNINRLSNAYKWSKLAGTKLLKVFDFPDQKFDSIPQIEIVSAIEKEVKVVKPDIVYTHFLYDINKDHQVTAEAVMVALRPISKFGLVSEIRAFETPSTTDQNPKIKDYSFAPNLYINVTNQWKKKASFLKAYSKEMKKFPHPRSLKSIKALALKRGSECMQDLAEAFIVIRKIEK